MKSTTADNLNGGVLIVSSGGTGNAVVNSGGTEIVSSGGRANGNDYVTAGGTEILLSGAFEI